MQKNNMIAAIASIYAIAFQIGMEIVKYDRIFNITYVIFWLWSITQ